MSTVRKAVIPAAGFGTRFLPYTKAMPKEMLNIVDKPALQYIVEEAVDSGITDILIIISRGKVPIENHFDKSPEIEDLLKAKNKIPELKTIEHINSLANIYYIRQAEMLGLGHAIKLAHSFTNGEPFAVMLGDDIVYNNDKPCLRQLIDKYEEFSSSILGVQSVVRSDTSKYGIIDGEHIDERTFKVNSLVEKPNPDNAPSTNAILGRYILTAGIYQELENTPKGKGGEIQLTDAISSLLKKESVYAYNFTGKRYDTGDKIGYLKATVEYALRDERFSDEFARYLKEKVCTL